MTRLNLVRLVSLLGVLVFGAYLRFSDLDWDNGLHFHPDERGILFVAQTISLPQDTDLFTHESPLNPLFDSNGSPTYYAYGHFHLYSIVAAERVIRLVCRAAPDICLLITVDTSDAALLSRLTFVARFLSAAADSITILVTAFLGYRLFQNPLATWLAAAFSAFAVIHIQNAHFGTVDSMLTLFSTLSIFGLVSYVQTGNRRFSIVAAVSIGLAVGCKSTGILLLGPMVVSHLTISRHGRRVRIRPRSPSALRELPSGLFLVTGVFVVTNPYAMFFPIEFVGNILAQTRMASGLLDWPFTRQYINTPRLAYHIVQQARWGLGLALTVVVYGGLVWSLIRAKNTRSTDLIIAISWPLIVLIVVGTQFVKFPRYLLPALPTLFALAGGMLASIRLSSAPYNSLLRTGVGSLILIPTVLYAVSFQIMFATPHPWITASEWIYRTIPAGSAIAGEHWDDRLPLNIVVDGTGFVRDEVYIPTTLDPFSEPDNEEKLTEIASALAASDYIVIATSRAYGTVARLDQRYPLMASAYRLLFAEELGFTFLTSFSRYPHLGEYQLTDDPFTRPDLSDPTGTTTAWALGFADESFTVYDHPLVLIFRNDDRLTPSEIFSRVTEKLADLQIRR